MIGTVDVFIQAQNPQIPLAPFRAYISSPSTVRVRNVPVSVGGMTVDSVALSVSFPDGTTAALPCRRVGEYANAWVCTVAGCATPGVGLRGFVVTADGTDENGLPVTGYVLGVGDVEILNRESAVEPGVVTFKGDKGDDGTTPHVGENGDWFLGDVDTGVKAQGPKGDKGDPGDVAVESVNGKTGAVELGAHDVGTLTDGEINDKINAFAAHYLTATAEGAAFATEAALTGATAFYYAGESATPTKNDYCIVLADAQGKTSRWSFVGTWGEGGAWNRQYAINDTQFSEGQWNAINSGATAAKIEKIEEIDDKLGEDNVDKTATFKESDDVPVSATLSPSELVFRFGNSRMAVALGTISTYNQDGDGEITDRQTLDVPRKDGAIVTDKDVRLVPVASEWTFEGAEDGVTYTVEWIGDGRGARINWEITGVSDETGEVVFEAHSGASFITPRIEIRDETEAVVFAANRTIYGYRLGENEQTLISLDELRNALGMSADAPVPRLMKLAAAPSDEDSGEEVKAKSRALFTSDNPVLAETTAGAVEDAAALDEDGVPASENLSALCSSANKVLGETIGAQIAAAIGPVDDALDAALGEEVA